MAPSVPGEGGDENFTDILDATFVDDECIAISASTPKALKIAIDILLDTLITVFNLCHLKINFEPGKTEACVQLRGKFAAETREEWRNADGSLSIPLNKYGVKLRCESSPNTNTLDHGWMHVEPALSTPFQMSKTL